MSGNLTTECSSLKRGESANSAAHFEPADESKDDLQLSFKKRALLSPTLGGYWE